MTRITNFGLKRTHLQAGLAENDSGAVTAAYPTSDAAAAESSSSQLPKKKRKRTPKSKRDGHAGEKRADGELCAVVATVDSTARSGVEPNVAESSTTQPTPKKKRKRTPKSKRDGYAAQKAAESANLNGEKSGVILAEARVVDEGKAEGPVVKAKKEKRNKDRKKKLAESRRLKRIKEKASTTTCFACREKGHSAKDCPNFQNTEKDDGGQDKVVGICYRCGSKKHSLSKCRKVADPSNPFPHASCFVCHGKGHLASKCPQNLSKGVYPNGGCCKLCGESSHLAKDCEIKQKVADPSTVVGLGRDIPVGADEDDFHVFKRRTTEIDQTEREEMKAKQNLEIKAGAHTGVVKAFGSVQTPKAKVVVFK